MRPAETARATGPAGRAVAERSFDVVGERVREARAWVRDVLPEGCGLAYACALVVSELFGNAVRYSAGGRASLTIVHGDGVRGRFVHFGEQSGVPEARAEAVAELTALTCSGEVAPDVDSLVEGGRGLLLARLSCSEDLVIRSLADRLVIDWVQDGCGCVRGTA